MVVNIVPSQLGCAACSYYLACAPPPLGGLCLISRPPRGQTSRFCVLRGTWFNPLCGWRYVFSGRFSAGAVTESNGCAVVAALAEGLRIQGSNGEYAKSTRRFFKLALHAVEVRPVHAPTNTTIEQSKRTLMFLIWAIGCSVRRRVRRSPVPLLVMRHRRLAGGIHIRWAASVEHGGSGSGSKIDKSPALALAPRRHAAPRA